MRLSLSCKFRLSPTKQLLRYIAPQRLMDGDKSAIIGADLWVLVDERSDLMPLGN